MSENETQWHVQVEEGLVKLWSIDQLDAAFKAGLIDESTFVLEDGTHEWQTLGALLGGDEPEASAPVAVQSYAPQAQVAVQSYAPQAAVVPAATPLSLPPMSFTPQSTAPMVSDLDDDMPVQFRSKKRGLAIGFSLALVAAGVAVAGFRFGSTATDAAAAPVAAVAPPPVVAPTPAPEPAPSAADATRLSDDQRRALADADKALQAKLDSQKKVRAAAAPHHSHGKSAHEKTPFQNGGAQGDPLNAKL
jgi:hypothetical protein